MARSSRTLARSNPLMRTAFQNPLPVTSDAEPMTAGGVFRSFILMFGVMLVVGAWSWMNVDTLGSPGLWFVAIIVAIGVSMLAIRKPGTARFLAPVFAALEGFFVGGVSAVYASVYPQIVPQAVMATLITTFVMATLYVTRTIRVTERFRAIVTTATMGVLVFYLLSWVLSFFNIGIPLVFDAGPIGILVSVGITALAAFNLLLDFDFIEKGVNARLDASYNWVASIGLLATIVWLYLELLRLISLLQSRD